MVGCHSGPNFYLGGANPSSWDLGCYKLENLIFSAGIEAISQAKDIKLSCRG